MSRSWSRLALVVAGLALALAAVRRLPPHPPASAAPEPPPPLDSLVLTVSDDGVRPGLAEFPLGHRLALTRVNSGHREVRLSLSGYEHRLAEAALGPGEARSDTFTLDLPGEDFAWRVDGSPQGRLRVAGSHLVAGHR